MTRVDTQNGARFSVLLLSLLVLGFLAFFFLGVTLGPRSPVSKAGESNTAAEQFHQLYYYSASRTWKDTRWLGVPLQKCPMDLVIYQEILNDTKPDVLIEAGTFEGGSALFFASIMDLLGRGKVITIDTVDQGRPPHPRITYLEGFSTAPDIVAAVKSMIRTDDHVMVVLDSDHSASNVLSELRVYAPLVTVGAYLVVEDTNLNGHPVEPSFGPGPAEALNEFLATSKGFARDATREKFFVTFNPGGFLRRVR